MSLRKVPGYTVWAFVCLILAVDATVLSWNRLPTFVPALSLAAAILNALVLTRALRSAWKKRRGGETR